MEPSSSIRRIFVALLAFSTVLGAETVETFDHQFDLAGVTRVQIGLKVGDLLVQAADGPRLDLLMAVRCKSPECRELADELELVSTRAGDELRLQVQGLTRGRLHGLSVDLSIQLPADLEVEIDVGAGDVQVRGLAGQLEIDVGVGNVEGRLPADRVHSVELDAGVGTARLIHANGTVEGSGVVSSGLLWSHGVAGARVEVDCGVGDIEVRLE